MHRLFIVLAACGSAAQPGTDASGAIVYGAAHTDGIYNLGPVDYSESEFHNACAPGSKYSSQVQSVEGKLLAGLWNGIPNVAGY